MENNSTEAETFDYYKEVELNDPAVRIVFFDQAFNFSKINNFGVQYASGDYYLFLNNDTEVITPCWIENMLGICQDPDVGAVGAKLLYRDDTIQHAGVHVNGNAAGHIGLNLDRNAHGYFNTAITTHEVSAVTAACLLTKRVIFEQVEGFSEEFPVAFNDVDYCLKIRDAGKLVIYCADVELYHYESLSRGYEDSLEKKMRFLREVSMLRYRWPRYYIEGDPFMNPNLAVENHYYRLKE